MSSNVGLTTPRGSGTSGYVQRNSALLKPRNTGYGAPYPPISGANGSGPMDRPFKQRMPDKQILEHDRKRAIEVKVMEERERLEEENERIEEEADKKKGKSGAKKEDGGEDGEEGEKVLSEEEIDERCDTLRQRLLKELEEDLERGESGFKKPFGAGAGAGRDRRNLKSYQVHELAEAKIEETERLRRAFGLREDRETGEISSSRDYRERRRD
ncbi:mRNA splicing factor Cwf21 [Penicillium cf. griseofulvum]|uniref:mRNA splicing factor Cwf21 n=1 Tax=Penicillium cf. griseofulvum TaxID=2972120 RepID=A0A9W9MQ85_9EURO|nr:mRNA splicing factor Cwf21 [Penicillium cf. griseofulvum]KAJ5437358.1 mRNA splicing factor Cwf21 [Penicillium cf. griseofulvum]KAJ5441505.1 mRNA splicing factor Cwf21 [Penicillium cf. griseofulvum]